MSIIISNKGKNAIKLDKSSFEKEVHLQQYIDDNPETIPLYDIKEDTRLLVLCREFQTNSGPIDAFGIDDDGNLYIIETKLYKNPDKRKVVAQVLDYGAAIWNDCDYEELTTTLESYSNKKFNKALAQRIMEFYGLDQEGLSDIYGCMKRNLENGNLKFVVLMDELDERLKDLIIYINQNSKFDIYAVELEYYKHETLEILIPKIYGAEVKKDIPSGGGITWDADSFISKIRKEFSVEEVTVVKKIIDWTQKNKIRIVWLNSQRGGFAICFYPSLDQSPSAKGFYPITVTGHGKVSWNAPRQGDSSPIPFNDPLKRKELLERLKSVKGSIVDSSDVDKYTALNLPIKALSDPNALDNFYSVLMWIQKEMFK